MSISNLFLSEKLIEGYVKTPPSLKDQALTKLSIKLCENTDLKKVIISNPDPLITEWESLVERQSSAMFETLFLPDVLKAPLLCRIRLIAIRLFAWNKEYQIRLGTTPHDTDQYLTSSDWTVDGRINESNVAERLVQNEAIPASLRYPLACLHFLETFIYSLWNQMLPEYREFYLGEMDPLRGQSKLVTFWSYKVAGRLEEWMKHGDKFWYCGFLSAVAEGQRTAVKCCWNALSEESKGQKIYMHAMTVLYKYDEAIKNEKLFYSSEKFLTPAHYVDILYFLFSHMSEEHIILFFEILFKHTDNTTNYSCSLFCFLEYPYQNYLIPIISKLWSILPEAHYERMLIELVKRYANSENRKGYQDYNYGHLFVKLLKVTPMHFKINVFRDRSLGNVRGEQNLGKILLLHVFKKQFFEFRDIEMIQNILQQVKMEEKQSIIYSDCGEELCNYLIKNKKRRILDSILAHCLPKEGILDFRRKFLLSHKGNLMCFQILAHENEDALKSLLNWVDFTEVEVSRIKPTFFNLWNFENELTKFLEEGKINCFDRILEWCLPYEGARKQFKDDLVRLYIGSINLPNLQCGNLNRFMSMAFPSEDAISAFKQKFVAEGHCAQMLKEWIRHGKWKHADALIEWSGLSSTEIEQLKVNVIFDTQILDMLLYKDPQTIYLYIKWGLSNQETVLCLKKLVDERLFTYATNGGIGKPMEERVHRRWDQVIKYRLEELAGEQLDSTIIEKME